MDGKSRLADFVHAAGHVSTDRDEECGAPRATAGCSDEARIEGSELRSGGDRSEYDLPHSDREQLGTLLTSLEPRLTAVALRFTRDPEHARDIVQSAFEKALRHAARFRGDSRVSTWMYRIVTNEALMWIRSQRRRSALHVEGCDHSAERWADPRPNAADLLERSQQHARLQREVERLPEAERDVLERCALAGLSYAEYAQGSGSHPAAIKSRAHRARRRLGRLLAEAEESESAGRTRPAAALRCARTP